MKQKEKHANTEHSIKYKTKTGYVICRLFFAVLKSDIITRG